MEWPGRRPGHVVSREGALQGLSMRVVTVALICLLLPGCAYYLSQRPPIMERKLGRPGAESIGALATAADYRMVYVKLHDDARMCAEPPPDAAGQIASLITASLKSTKDTAPFSAEMLNGLSVSMKQLFQRMQGVQMYRDGAFAYCNMYINGVIDHPTYDKRMAELLTVSVNLVAQELKDRKDYPDFDNTPAPTYPPAAPKPADEGASSPSVEKPEGGNEDGTGEKVEEDPVPAPAIEGDRDGQTARACAAAAHRCRRRSAT